MTIPPPQGIPLAPIGISARPRVVRIGFGDGTSPPPVVSGGFDNVNTFPQVTTPNSGGYRPVFNSANSILSWVGPIGGGASTTNDPAQTRTLTASGGIATSANGQVIQGLNISGGVQINHSNVTLKQCYIAGASPCVGVTGGIGGVLIEDCEIDGQGGVGVTGIWPGHPTNTLLTGTGLTVRRCNTHSFTDGVSISQGPMTYKDSIIWDLVDGGNPSANHCNGIQHNGGNLGQITIDHNQIANTLGQTDAIMLDDLFGAVQNVTVNNNLLRGGDFVIYLDCHFSNTTPTNVIVTNNAMDITSPYTAFGYHDFNPNYPNTFSGNYDYLTNAPVT